METALSQPRVLVTNVSCELDGLHYSSMMPQHAHKVGWWASSKSGGGFGCQWQWPANPCILLCAILALNHKSSYNCSLVTGKTHTISDQTVKSYTCLMKDLYCVAVLWRCTCATHPLLETLNRPYFTANYVIFHSDPFYRHLHQYPLFLTKMAQNPSPWDPRDTTQAESRFCIQTST